MGNCNFKVENLDQSSGNYSLVLIIIAINKNHFKFHCVVGKGGFGKVFLIIIISIIRFGKLSVKSLRHFMQ